MFLRKKEKKIEMVDIYKEMAKRLKQEERKAKFKKVARNVGAWVYTHQSLLMVTIPVIGCVANNLFQTHRINMENAMKQCNEWDPKTGHYWAIKRPLKVKEALELEARYRNGENKGDILNSMRLLK